MTRKMGAYKPPIRYSEAFKIAVVRELERDGLPMDRARRKYGIGAMSTVRYWVRKYGNGTRGKVIRVEKPEEINELKRLKERVRKLETALADAHLEAAFERAYTRLACKRAGITDIEAFKKKTDGLPPAT